MSRPGSSVTTAMGGNVSLRTSVHMAKGLQLSRVLAMDSGLGPYSGSIMARTLDCCRRRVMHQTRFIGLASRLRQRVSRWELKVAWAIINLLDLNIMRAFISQLDLELALIVGS
jgi:hypothetical protein